MRLTKSILFLCLLILLTACGEIYPLKKQPQIKTSQNPDIHGKITDVFKANGQVNAIQVEGVLEKDTKYDQATLRITENTRIYSFEGNTYQIASPDQLIVGMRVKALFTGIILERYPVSAEAQEIIIIANP